jgi:hypothetical protein
MHKYFLEILDKKKPTALTSVRLANKRHFPYRLFLLIMARYANWRICAG